MNYVMHFCRNKECNNGWIDKDLTNASAPTKWKYCSNCCEKLGIDYNAQTPTSNLTKIELENRAKKKERFLEALAKQKNIKSLR